MNAKSINGKSIVEIESALRDSMLDGFCPTLAIVFVSKSLKWQTIKKMLDEKNIDIYGCTTHGEFTNELPQSDSAAILLLDLNRDFFQVYFEEYPNQNYREVSSAITKKAKGIFKKPAFIVGLSNPTTDGEEILQGIEDVAGKEVNAFGAGAGDDYAFTQSFVFTNNYESDNGMVCIAIDEEKVEIQGIATCGWKAVGTEKTVTKSEGNHVFTIDNIPVLDITAKYGGLENVNPDNSDLITEIAANFPLQLQREKGEPIMRPGLMIDWSDHSFYTSGSVPQGSKVRFSLPPDFDVVEKVLNDVRMLKLTTMPEADALIVFSCGGRKLSFGPLMVKELEGIKNVWNVPMAGMFSNAELARAIGGNLEMHNLTTCCVALKEK